MNAKQSRGAKENYDVKTTQKQHGNGRRGRHEVGAKPLPRLNKSNAVDLEQSLNDQVRDGFSVAAKNAVRVDHFRGSANERLGLNLMGGLSGECHGDGTRRVVDRVLKVGEPTNRQNVLESGGVGSGLRKDSNGSGDGLIGCGGADDLAAERVGDDLNGGSATGDGVEAGDVGEHKRAVDLVPNNLVAGAKRHSGPVKVGGVTDKVRHCGKREVVGKLQSRQPKRVS